MAAGVKLFLRGRGVARVVALALLMILGGCAKKGDPTDAAKHFFALLAAGEIDKAYSETAFGFQAEQSALAFTQNVQDLDLTHQTSQQWEPAEVTDDSAHLPVEITTASGDAKAFKVSLVRETGAWRVHSLRLPRGLGRGTENRFSLVGKGAAFTDLQGQPLPSEEEILKLAQTTMTMFDEAVEQKSFAHFYESVSAAWRKQLTIPQLERAFAPFVNAEVHIGGISQAEMQLDGPPTINPEGILLVNGHFNTAPYQVYFSMKFVHEQPWWKLFGLDVRLQR